MLLRSTLATSLVLTVALGLAACGGGRGSDFGSNNKSAPSPRDKVATATPIKHLVVIFGENVSFDHYFATYPTAANPGGGEPEFTAAAETPTDIRTLENDGLNNANNPNKTNTANAPNATAPFRLDRSQANTRSQNHGYTAEQQAYDNGAADLFPKYTGRGTAGGAGAFGTAGQVMGHFDGNTVTALWNYAQHFAMNDNAYTDTYGPSTPGAIEVVSGQTNGAVNVLGSGSTVDDGQGGLSVIGDPDPAGDNCSSNSRTIRMTSKNIGDLLSAADITWGGFMGGFNLTLTNPNGSTGCNRSRFSSVLNSSPNDYVPHHAWFQYYASTANPTHARPSSIDRIGYSTEADGTTPDPANHDYDIQDFFAAVQAGNFPSVSYLKAPAIADGHPVNSDPLDEQTYIARVINFLQQQPDWKNTAVIVLYDDSDGWYDHRYATPTYTSLDANADRLNGVGVCQSGTSTKPEGVDGLPVNGRCGPGTRIPFLVISPWAKVNYVDDTRLTQSSVVKFIEDNWLGGQRIGQGSDDAAAGSIMGMFDFSKDKGQAPKVCVDPSTGLVTPCDQVGGQPPTTGTS